MKLIIGNKNYSTWSLRPWLLLKAFNIEYEELLVSLGGDDLRQRLLQYSASAKVPVLHDDDLEIWDTLAICEYVSEVYLGGKGWPNDTKQRALARSITSEMHSGFGNIRNELPMNIRSMRSVEISDATKVEINHIDEIWSKSRKNGYLFDEYGIVDCFFTPVASRFKTYGIKLSPIAQSYADKLLAHPAMQEWSKAAKLETEILSFDEAGVDI